MSTVIRPAYRTPPSVNLFKLVHDLRVRGKALRKLYSELHAEVRGDRLIELQNRYGDWQMARIATAQEVILRGYRMQLGKPYRGPFNLDVSIAIREHGGDYYIRPHCDWTMGKVLDFLAEDPRLEDYSYWNRSAKGVNARPMEAS